MSPEIRQELAIDTPHEWTMSWPQLHSEYRMGRPVFSKALAMALYLSKDI